MFDDSNATLTQRKRASSFSEENKNDMYYRRLSDAQQATPASPEHDRFQQPPTLLQKIESFIYVSLELPAGHVSWFGRILNALLFFVVAVSISNFVISTESFVVQNPIAVQVSNIIEAVCIAIFVCEYIARFVVSTARESYYHQYGPFCGKLRYLLSFSSIVDFLSIFPPAIVLIIGFAQRKRAGVYILREMIAFRVLRVLRLLKAERFFKASEMIKNVIVRKYRELSIAAFLYLVTVLFAATAIYYAENDDQPSEFGTMVQLFDIFTH